MIITGQYRSKNSDLVRIELSSKNQSSFSMRIMVMWMSVLMLLLPVKIFQFPFNIELSDFWILMGLPVIWLLFLLENRPIGFPYFVPMWLILIISIISSLFALNKIDGLITILKEAYLYVLFVTVTTILSTISERDFRRIVFIWSGVVILHGLLIIAQSLLPDLWRMTTHFSGKEETWKVYRPSGLFADPDKAGNANKAAYFQLLGFVPLLILKPSKKVAVPLGLLLLASIFVTGSMGALSALSGGVMLIVITIAVLKQQYLVVITKILGLSIVGALIFGGLFYILVNQNQVYADRLETIVHGRAEKSSESRFSLWSSGIEIFFDSNVPIWGVGPQNFKAIDELNRTQLHNDLLAFLVERGWIGALSLIIFGVTVVSRTIYLLLIHNQYPGHPPFEVMVFLGAFGATLVESVTHQIFHTQQLWLVLALQEAIIFRMLTKTTPHTSV